MARMAFDRGQHVDEAAKDVRAYRLAFIGTGHRKDFVGRNTEVIRPKPNKALDEADLGGDGGFDADFGLRFERAASAVAAAAGPAGSEPVPAWQPTHPRLISSHCRRPRQQLCPSPPFPSWRAAPAFPSLAVRRETRKRHAPPARCWADSLLRPARRQAVRGRPAMRRVDRLRLPRLNRRPVRNRTGAMRVLLRVWGWSSCCRPGPAHRSCGGRICARSAASAEQPSNFINDGTAVVIAASLRRQRKPFDG